MASAAPRHCALSEVKNHTEIIGVGAASGGATLGNSRSCPSQGSFYKYSTRHTKRIVYLSSPKKSICGRRADGTVRRRPDTVPSVPWPRIEILGDDTYILRLLARVEYLESLPCDGQPLGWPARRPHTVRSEVKNHPRIGRGCC